jgi:hypothetical protein
MPLNDNRLEQKYEIMIEFIRNQSFGKERECFLCAWVCVMLGDANVSIHKERMKGGG